MAPILVYIHIKETSGQQLHYSRSLCFSDAPGRRLLGLIPHTTAAKMFNKKYCSQLVDRNKRGALTLERMYCLKQTATISSSFKWPNAVDKLSVLKDEILAHHPQSALSKAKLDSAGKTAQTGPTASSALLVGGLRGWGEGFITAEKSTLIDSACCMHPFATLVRKNADRFLLPRKHRLKVKPRCTVDKLINCAYRSSSFFPTKYIFWLHSPPTSSRSDCANRCLPSALTCAGDPRS